MCRPLRVYERHGLITPQRTGKDWRLCGANEVARLNEVLALKALGLSLSRIADLLDGKSTDLGRTLAVQREALQGVCQRAQRGLAMIGILQDKLAGGATIISHRSDSRSPIFQRARAFGAVLSAKTGKFDPIATNGALIVFVVLDVCQVD